MRCEQRRMYPGASAFDFSAILNIVISDILGWDEDQRCSFPHGGAFGKIDAFSGAVEEQGRKTLHCHMLIYIKDLSKLIEAIQRTINMSALHGVVLPRNLFEMKYYVQTVINEAVLK
eukprot:scaffold39271_cov59-Attheya_sp.AAC.3